MEQTSKEPEVKSTQLTFINPDQIVSPAILAGILGRNVSLLYQWAQAGRLPSPLSSFTYRECLTHLMDFHSKEGNRRVKVRAPAGGGESEDNIHPLMAAKLEQSVKTEYAREAQLWQAIAIKNEEYVSFANKLADLEPFILNIRDLLLGIALDFPETQSAIDEGMENLYKLGTRMLEEVKIDRDEFVQTMLDKPIDELDELK